MALIVEDLRRGLDLSCAARDAFHEAGVNDDDVVVVAQAVALRDDLNAVILRARALIAELS